ncbi:MAG TPA: hypothetical protein PK360_19145, partial [bacterium]|nr:hypothetical protein [bacterium]
MKNRLMDAPPPGWKIHGLQHSNSSVLYENCTIPPAPVYGGNHTLVHFENAYTIQGWHIALILTRRQKMKMILK